MNDVRLIDANALKKAILDLDLDNSPYWLVVKAIDNAPTIDTRQKVRHVILNHPHFGKCDACYDEARQLVFYPWITKELADQIGWKIEEAEK